MVKKGQVSFFIVLGIIILISAVFYYAISSSYKGSPAQPIEIKLDSQSMKDYVESCFQKKLVDSISIVSIQGGYTGIPDYDVDFKFESIQYPFHLTYYLYDGENVMPPLDMVEREIGFEVKKAAVSCTNLSAVNPNIQSSAKISNYSSNVNILKDRIVVEIDVPIEMRTSNAVFKFDKIIVEAPSSMGTFYEAANNITEAQKGFGNEVCMSCMPVWMTRYNITIKTVEADNGLNYYVLYSLMKGDEPPYNFVHRIKKTATPIIPIIEGTGSLNATAGYKFTYKVKAAGKNISFSDNSPLFDIGKYTGIIEFTPTHNQVGKYIVSITAQDINGATSSEDILLSIRELGSYPEIEPIGYLTANVGQNFTYQVKASSPIGLNITFIDSSPLFQIGSGSGLIDFVPTSAMAGAHSFNVTAIDSKGWYSTEEGYIIVR